MLGNVFTNYLNQKKSMPKTFPGDTKFRQNTWVRHMRRIVWASGNKQNTDFKQNTNLIPQSKILQTMTKISKIFWAADNVKGNWQFESSYDMYLIGTCWSKTRF